jgi:hypothetical protein
MTLPARTEISIYDTGKASPGAKIIPFPSSRRKAFIARTAAHAARYSASSSKNFIASVIRRHAQRLQQRGVDKHLLEADVRELRNALKYFLDHIRTKHGA